MTLPAFQDGRSFTNCRPSGRSAPYGRRRFASTCAAASRTSASWSLASSIISMTASASSNDADSPNDFQTTEAELRWALLRYAAVTASRRTGILAPTEEQLGGHGFVRFVAGPQCFQHEVHHQGRRALVLSRDNRPWPGRHLGLEQLDPFFLLLIGFSLPFLSSSRVRPVRQDAHRLSDSAVPGGTLPPSHLHARLPWRPARRP